MRLKQATPLQTGSKCKVVVNSVNISGLKYKTSAWVETFTLQSQDNFFRDCFAGPD